jgi:hypothetical protein
MKWHPKGRINKSGPKLTWINGVQSIMLQIGLIEEEWGNWLLNVPLSMM